VTDGQAATKPGPVSANVKRRQKLVQRIDQQIGYCDAMKSGQMPRAAWAWMDETGSYFLPIKYGRQHIELKKGMFSILCKDIPELDGALKTVREMVLSGDFDGQLIKASADIRKRFSGKD
jgi:hypothetical protein